MVAPLLRGEEDWVRETAEPDVTESCRTYGCTMYTSHLAVRFSMRSSSNKVLGIGLLLILFASFSSAQVSFPSIQTSGNRRFIEHIGKEKTLQGQLLAARTEAQRLLKQVNHNPMSSAADDDWAFDVGTHGPASGFPTTHTAGLTPDCVNDHISFTIHAQGTSTQANVVIVNNLYVDTGGTGFCSGTTPNVVAAYKVGTAAAGNYLGDPWPSVDGTKIVVLEKGLAGTATPAKLHVITIGAGGGTVAAPIVPPTETVLSYTAGSGACASGLSGAPSLKDMAIWYASGNLYTGDDNGRIYKITNAFTTPAVAYCISTGSNPITDVNVDENVTGQPAGTNYVNIVALGKTLQSYSANSGATAFTSRWSTVVSSVNNGITDFTVEDGELNFIYLMTNHESTGANAQLQQYSYAGTLVGSVTVGPASSQNLNMGAWDHNYQNNVNAKATFYYCAYPSGAAGLPNLSDVQFNSSWSLNSSPTMTGDTNIQPFAAVNGSTCGSLLGFYFEDKSTTPNPTIDLIVGVGDGIASDPNQVSRWRLQTPTTNRSPITSNTFTWAQHVTNEPGGMSAATGDWSSRALVPNPLTSNTYNFYFGTLASQLAGRPHCAVGHYCFVKLQVEGLN